MATSVLEALVESFELEIVSLTMAVTSGVADFSEYQKMCGRIYAFRRAQEITRDVERALQQADE